MQSRKRGRSVPDDPDDGVEFDETLDSTPSDFASLLKEADHHIKQQPDETDTYAKFVKAEKTKADIEDPGSIICLDEYSNMSLLLANYREIETVHYAMPKAPPQVPTRMDEIESVILRKRGALSLPPKDLCDKIVLAYFKWVAPIVPVIDKVSFMQHYGNIKNPPSMLLMQAILLAGSRVCSVPLLPDASGTMIPAQNLFYQRAKALYDAGYEVNRVTIVQALILMGWYWEDDKRVMKNVFYWNGLATTIAHGCGIHRSTRGSRLSLTDQKLWRRIWWTLFTRDRAVAVALGRPTHINMSHSDVEMVTEDDFLEEGQAPVNPTHVKIFLEYVKLCEIMDLVLLENYSIAKAQRQGSLALTQCDAALTAWIRNCPMELRWDQSKYDFWSAYLQCVYLTTSCLLHRAYLPPTPSSPVSGEIPGSPAFQAADTLTSIIQQLVIHNELRYAPTFM